MSFEISNPEHFAESFITTAKHLASLQARYDHHKEESQRIRMELIGIAEEQKAKYPQRSPEAQYIQQGYEANGWTEDIIKKNKAAWRAYTDFLSNVNIEIQEFAKACNVGHLYEFSRPDSGSMWWDAMKYLKRHKKMPSVKQLRGYREGFTDNKFKFRGGSSGTSRKISSLDVSTDCSSLEANTTHQLVHDSDLSTFVPTLTRPQQTDLPSDLRTNAYSLIQTLQQIVDQLLDIRPQWEGDHRVTELIDAKRLSDLTNQLCAGRYLGWDF
jgi:hypothetical protein